MTKSVFTLSTLSIIFLVSSAFMSGDWVVFQKDNYKILFPSMPSTDSTTTVTKIGNVTAYNHMYESPETVNDSNLVYGFSVTDYPQKYILSTEKAFLNGFFDGLVKGVVENINGKLITTKEIVLKNYPGREIKVDYGNGTAILTMRIILVKARVFGVQTISFPGKEINNNSSKFYNSFDIQ